MKQVKRNAAEVPDRYLTLLGPTGKRFEPALTKWLHDLAGQHKSIWDAILRRVLDLGWTQSPSSIFEEQVSFGPGITADFVFRNQNGTPLAVVEAKVEEPLSSFQLSRYFDHPAISTNKTRVISLTPHPTLSDIFQDHVSQRGLIRSNWSELCLGITNLSGAAKRDFSSFIEFAEHAGAIASSGRELKGKDFGKQEHGLWLSQLAELLKGWDYILEAPPGIAPRLRLGRERWKRVFGDHHWRRLLLYRHDGIKFGTCENIHFQVLLFHKADLPCDPVSPETLGKWLGCTREAGLKDYGPAKGRRANTSSEMVTTPAADDLLTKMFLVTLEPQEDAVVRFNGDIEIAAEKVRDRLKFYDKLVGSFESYGKAL